MGQPELPASGSNELRHHGRLPQVPLAPNSQFSFKIKNQKCSTPLFDLHCARE